MNSDFYERELIGKVIRTHRNSLALQLGDALAEFESRNAGVERRVASKRGRRRAVRGRPRQRAIAQ